ncbi:cell wall protein IFF6-like [Rhagoletis pomonella]|uniref:cell wall protein IFF6-like n=1 Tax=Rhagoletis pomonella TaxID=28610 RepID=UPI00177DDF1B|nr:cell wall protein IFF6-like [Rhagoletis pomonella]
MNANQLASEVAAKTAITTGNTNKNNSPGNTSNIDVADESMNLSVLGKHEKIAKHLKSVAAGKPDVKEDSSKSSGGVGYEPKQNGQYRECDEHMDGRETPTNSWQHHRVNGEKSATTTPHGSSNSNSSSAVGDNKPECGGESPPKNRDVLEEGEERGQIEGERERAESPADEGDYGRLHTATIIKTPLTKTLLKRCSGYSALSGSSGSGNGNGNGSGNGNGHGYGSSTHIGAPSTAHTVSACCSGQGHAATTSATATASATNECGHNCCAGRDDDDEEAEGEQQQASPTLVEHTAFNGEDERSTPPSPQPPPPPSPSSQASSSHSFLHKMPTAISTATTESTAADATGGSAAKCSKCNNNNNIHYNNYNCYYRKKSRMPICR